jgi:hypothetical protein
MRKILATVFVGAVLVSGASPALAIPHPSQGDNSEGRNVQGFGGPTAPHCHVLIVNKTKFDSTPAFPSHKGHAASGLTKIFAADPNCDGIAG